MPAVLQLIEKILPQKVGKKQLVEQLVEPQAKVAGGKAKGASGKAKMAPLEDGPKASHPSKKPAAQAKKGSKPVKGKR